MICLFYDNDIERMNRNFEYFVKKSNITFVRISSLNKIKDFSMTANAVFIYYQEEMWLESLYLQNPGRARIFILGMESKAENTMTGYMLNAAFVKEMYEAEMLYHLIDSEKKNITSIADNVKARSVDELFKKCKISIHLQGIAYLKQAVMLCCTNNEMLCGITKMLYPQIAANFDSNAASVERAMRTAIEHIWVENREELSRLLFLKCDARPTNKTFIYACVRYIKDTY